MIQGKWFSMFLKVKLPHTHSDTSLEIDIFQNNLINSTSGNLIPINLFQLGEWGQTKSFCDLSSNRHIVPEEMLSMEWYLAQEG